jgi:hypothetical protein
MSNDAPITKEMMELYVEVLQKQVQQTTLIVKTLEELNDKLNDINKHFTNGFKSDITDHISSHVSNVVAQMEKTMLRYEDMEEVQHKEMNDKVYELRDEMKDSFVLIKDHVTELKSAIKVDNVTNLIGLGTFVLGILTIILKVFGVFGKL